MFSKVAVLFYVSTSSVWEFQLFYILPGLGKIIFIFKNLVTLTDMYFISCCSFRLRFPSDYRCWASFHVLCSSIFFCEVSVHIFCLLFKLGFFLLIIELGEFLRYSGSSILDPTLSYVCVMKFFSQVAFYLFLLLMVSFKEWKVWILKKSSLSALFWFEFFVF